MTAPEIISIIGAVAAAVVSVLSAWNSMHVRAQLQQHVRNPYGHPAAGGPASSQQRSKRFGSDQ